MNYQKCAVIGCGAVGAATAYTLVHSGVFSEVVLLDKDQKRARGEAMDISHSIPYVRPVNAYTGDYSDLTDCGIIIITAGANQAPGETRIDLVRKNAAIFCDIIPRITKYCQESFLLVVSNPVDILTYVALRLSGFPPHRVIGSGTVLDTARFKLLLGDNLGVDPRNIHAFILGEHGDTEFPVWSSANVSGIDLNDFYHLRHHQTDFDFHDIFGRVRDSAYHIIEDKGATCFGIATAVLRIIEAIVRDEHSVLPVSVLADGHYDLHDLCIGLPSVVGRTGIERILDFPLNETENKALNASADALLKVLNGLEGLPK